MAAGSPAFSGCSCAELSLLQHRTCPGANSRQQQLIPGWNPALRTPDGSPGGALAAPCCVLSCGGRSVASVGGNRAPSEAGRWQQCPGKLRAAERRRAWMWLAAVLPGNDHRIFNDASWGFNLMFISNLISSGHVCNAVLEHWLGKDLGKKKSDSPALVLSSKLN